MTSTGRSTSRNTGAILPIEPQSRKKGGTASDPRRLGGATPPVQAEGSSAGGLDQVKVIPRLGIVVPCFNEEEVLPETSRRLVELLESLMVDGRVANDSQIVFVDDGSRDGTWELIESLASADHRIGGIKLSRNRGHQNALLAGLYTYDADVLLSVDADLQDDIGVIPEMLQAYARGAHIVYGVRNDRSSDGLFKRATAQGFYRLMSTLGAESVYNHADFRLMSRRAVDAPNLKSCRRAVAGRAAARPVGSRRR